MRTALLTPNGKSTVDKAAKERFTEATQAIACFNNKDKETLINTLHRMGQWLEDHNQDLH